MTKMQRLNFDRRRERRTEKEMERCEREDEDEGTREGANTPLGPCLYKGHCRSHSHECSLCFSLCLTSVRRTDIESGLLNRDPISPCLDSTQRDSSPCRVSD